jgi:phospholipase C
MPVQAFLRVIADASAVAIRVRRSRQTFWSVVMARSDAPALHLGFAVATVLTAALAVVSCGGRGELSTPAVPILGTNSFGTHSATRSERSISAGKIQHVVFVLQENRSFDNLFQGYPGADTASSGLNSKGQTIALRPISLKELRSRPRVGRLLQRIRQRQDGRLRPGGSLRPSR